MIPIWFKTKDDRWLTLTHYEDGKIGIPATEFTDLTVFTTKQLDTEVWEYDVRLDRYIMVKNYTE